MAANMDFPESHIISPRGIHTHTIIILHGRNSNGEDFADEIFEGLTHSGALFASSSAFDNIKWLFPNARSTYCEQFQEDMTEWFDLPSTSDPYREPERQVAGLGQAVDHVRGIIEEEMKNIAGNRILLGGMSQGFATSVHVLLNLKAQKVELAGFFGISGWLPMCDIMTGASTDSSSIEYLRRLDITAGTIPATQITRSKLDEATPISHPKDDNIINVHVGRLDISTAGTIPATPILLTHSKDDEVIDIQFGRDAHACLRILGMDPVLKEYTTGGHEINEPDGFSDIETFIRNVFFT